jgi:UDP-2-acetamido-3-amino-2,3-dideoxy-glucuronate N-acetyltransferase
MSYFIHESSFVDPGTEIGNGSKIWHFCHVGKNVKIGNDCVFGQNVFIADKVSIGSKVKIQNNVAVYAGCEIHDEVFLGPSCVLTNVTNPRSQVNRQALYEKTVFKRGCTIGANATIVCGISIGRYAFIGAGSVITKDVPDYGLYIGNPGKQVGWMSRHGHILKDPIDNIMKCPESGLSYTFKDGNLICIDLDEEEPLPESLKSGKNQYDTYK